MSFIWTVLILSLLALFAWRAPIFFLPAFVAFSLLVGEWYPISDFPMYSDPDESENYLYVEEVGPDGVRRPIAVETATGITAPKVKKMYKSRIRAFAAAEGIHVKELSPGQKAAVGSELISYLRGQAGRKVRAAPLPDRLALVDYWITAIPGGGFSEEPTVIYSD